MRLFTIPAGTLVAVTRDGKSPEKNAQICKHLTRKQQTFELEEMVLDPIGKLTRPDIDQHAAQPGRIGPLYSQTDRYGFARDGWVIFVSSDNVRVL